MVDQEEHATPDRALRTPERPLGTPQWLRAFNTRLLGQEYLDAAGVGSKRLVTGHNVGFPHAARESAFGVPGSPFQELHRSGRQQHNASPDMGQAVHGISSGVEAEDDDTLTPAAKDVVGAPTPACRGHKRRIRWDEELGDQENRHPGQQLPEATKRPVLMGWVTMPNDYKPNPQMPDVGTPEAAKNSMMRIPIYESGTSPHIFQEQLDRNPPSVSGNIGQVGRSPGLLALQKDPFSSPLTGRKLAITLTMGASASYTDPNDGEPSGALDETDLEDLMKTKDGGSTWQ